jgi:hypothetical protein
MFMYCLDFIFLIVYELLGFTFMYWLDSCLDSCTAWICYLDEFSIRGVKKNMMLMQNWAFGSQDIRLTSFNKSNVLWTESSECEGISENLHPSYISWWSLCSAIIWKFAPFLRIMMVFSLSNYLKICSVLLHDLSIKCVAKVVALARAKADKAYWLCFYDVFFWLLLFLHALMGTRGKGGWAAWLERS